MVVHLLRRVYLLHLTVLEDDDPVGHRHGLCLVVGDVDARCPDPVVQLGDLRPHLHPEFGVEVTERLVHKERLRLADYGPSEGHPLSLATGEGFRLPIQKPLDGEYPRGLVHAPVDLGLVHLPELEGEAHVLPHVHVRVEGVVLEDHRDVPLARRKLVDDLISDKHLAGADVLEAGDHAQRRRLTTPRRPDEHDELPVGDIQVHLVDGDHVLAEDFGYLLEGYFSHPLPPSIDPNAASPVASRALVPLYQTPFYLMPARPAQVVLLLDREHPTHRLPDAAPRYLPRLNGMDHGIIGVGLLLRRAGDYEQVGPRPDGPEGGLGHRAFAPGPGHRQIVGDDDAIEAEILTQHA